jgi:site-specific DNA recombinase
MMVSMNGNGKKRTTRPPGRLVLDSYARLSRVPETGELEKIETQLADNAKVIERVGGELGQELSDGLSAWKRGVRRPDWERLLQRVESGESDGIVVWHTDRLFRQPRDLETLIELADKGFKIYSARGERDLSNPDDRFILRIEVAHAARSSDDTSRRIRRRFATKRSEGMAWIGGPRRFGWPGKDQTWAPGPDQDEEDRPDVPMRQVEREREALREGSGDALKGVTLNALANRWNEQGLRTVDGNEWSGTTVKSVLRRPTNAGLVEHGGELVARMKEEPIVDPDTFARLRALFATRRRGRRWGEVGVTYVGSGIIRCGECGRKLYGQTQAEDSRYPNGTRRTAYRCAKQRRGCGKVLADGRRVDAELRALTIVRLSDPRHAAAIEYARTRVADRLSKVNAEIGDCETIQEGLSARLGRREMTLEAFDAANVPLVADLKNLREERKQLEAESPEVATPTDSREAVARRWDAAEVPERRNMLMAALGRHVVQIRRASRRGAPWDPERVQLVKPDSARNGEAEPSQA